jgi:hypothetical protein
LRKHKEQEPSSLRTRERRAFNGTAIPAMPS